LDLKSRILILGAGGLIGGEIASQLKMRGFENVTACTHSELELTNREDVQNYFQTLRPEYVFFCAVKAITDFGAGRVGDAEELEENILMVTNTLRSCRDCGVKKSVFLGSAMLYPWNITPAPERFTEEMLDEFNLKGYSRLMESAVLSKLLTYKLCCYYRKQYGSDIICCLPVHIYGGFSGRKNLYLLERMVMELCDGKQNDATEVKLNVYGQGIARKSIMHVDDCADAVITVMEHYHGDSLAVNIAPEETTCWSEVTEEICKIIDYHGKVYFNTEKHENLTARICDSGKLKALGWKPRYTLESGLKKICAEYMEMKKNEGR